MGRGSNLSVIGLYNYSENLFNGLSLPAGMTDDDKSVLIDNILFECADLEVLYPSWTFMYRAISAWSKKQLPTWTRIYNLSQMEYDPIENFNRLEEVTETREGAQEHSGNDVVAMSGSDTDTSKTTGTEQEQTIRDNSETSTGTNSTVVASDATDTHTGSDVTTEQKTAFDANTYADTRKTTLQHGETISNDTNSTTTGNASATIETDDDETVTTTHNTTVTDTHQRGTSETTTHGLKVSNDETFTRNVHMYGNIGVTTSQQMATQEIELSPKLNMFNIIVNEFKDRFCLQVY